MKKVINSYIEKWNNRGYPNDIPDEVPNRLNELKKAPSYKGIALAILNNDYNLSSLGMSVKKSIYYHILKKIELNERNS